MKPKQKRIAYCIQKPNGVLIPWTIRPLKRVSINWFITCSYGRPEWKDYQEDGYKCVKISITKLQG